MIAVATCVAELFFLWTISMKIVSFNINGIRARLHQLQALINKHQPDIIGLKKSKYITTNSPLPMLKPWAITSIFMVKKVTMVWR